VAGWYWLSRELDFTSAEAAMARGGTYAGSARARFATEGNEATVWALRGRSLVLEASWTACMFAGYHGAGVPRRVATPGPLAGAAACLGAAYGSTACGAT
jgi:hypothetical protein